MELFAIIATAINIITGIKDILQTLLKYLKKPQKKVSNEQLAFNEEATHLPELPNVFSVPESNLPRREPFIGRVRERQDVLRALASPLPITSITGMGGIGKSALACEVAYESLDKELFETAIWISARDYKLTLEDIADTILAAAGFNFAFKLSAAKKRLLVQKVLRKYKLLLIIDNYETISEIKEILSFINNVPAPSKVLLTSRREVIVNTVPIRLKGMVEADALKFIYEYSNVIGLKSVNKMDEAILRDLAKSTGYAPLALKWALGQIKQKGQSIEMVLDRLRSAKGDIFEAMFDYSWALLDDASKIVLRAASVFVAPTTQEAYKATTRLEKSKLEEAISQLVILSLLDASDDILLIQRRYSVHPLTRSFAEARLRQSGNLKKQLEANSAHFFLRYAVEHGGDKWNWRSFDALEREYANIVNAIEWYFSQRDWQAIKSFRNALTLFLSIRGHWNKRIELGNYTLQACQKTNDNRLYAWCLVYDLAYIELKRGHIKTANKKVQEGLHIFKKCKDDLGVATAIRHMGRIEHMRGNYESAKALYQESYELYVKQDLEYGAFLLWDLGDLHLTLKDYNTAEDYFKKALKISEDKIGKSEVVQAMASGCLGELAEMHGEMDTARSYYLKELSIAQKIGRADEIALANKRLAKLLLAAKDYASALKFAQAAYLVYYQLADDKEATNLRQMIQQLENRVKEAVPQTWLSGHIKSAVNWIKHLT